jgi:hypothetical protein
MREKMPFVFAAFLIFFFGFRMLVPAHEYMSKPELIMSFVFDAGILLGLIGTRSRLPPWLFWLALVCGLGLFAIRFTSDHAWWTGRLMYELT